MSFLSILTLKYQSHLALSKLINLYNKFFLTNHNDIVMFIGALVIYVK